MKVRYGQVLVYHPNLLDAVDGRTGLKSGDVVKVIKVAGCPAANVMGHCYVGNKDTGAFIGMVSTNSLYTISEWNKYMAKRCILLSLKLLVVSVPKSTYENVKGGSQALFDELVESGHIESCPSKKELFRLTETGREACM